MAQRSNGRVGRAQPHNRTGHVVEHRNIRTGWTTLRQSQANRAGRTWLACWDRQVPEWAVLACGLPARSYGAPNSRPRRRSKPDKTGPQAVSRAAARQHSSSGCLGASTLRPGAHADAFQRTRRTTLWQMASVISPRQYCTCSPTLRRTRCHQDPQGHRSRVLWATRVPRAAKAAAAAPPSCAASAARDADERGLNQQIRSIRRGPSRARWARRRRAPAARGASCRAP